MEPNDQSNWGTPKNARNKRWGHLFIVREWRSEIKAATSSGEEYVADTHGPIMWQLRCDCGYEWEIERNDFPGKRIARDCNRPECRFAQERRARQPGRKQPRERLGRPPKINGKPVSVYMSESVKRLFEVFAARREMTFSAAVVYLATEGLKRITADES